MKETKLSDIGRGQGGVPALPAASRGDSRSSPEASGDAASRRFATAIQMQLALARVQILDAKRALHDAGVELDRARGLGIGVEKPRD